MVPASSLQSTRAVSSGATLWYGKLPLFLDVPRANLDVLISFAHWIRSSYGAVTPAKRRVHRRAR
jgi:hypothetical protein